jgi:AraC-like DNA-binding protein
MKIDNFDLVLLNAARKVHDADWNWKNVNSPFARLYLVESGTAKIIMPDGEHTISPGHLYLIPSFVTHSYENNSLFTIYYFHIYSEPDIFDLMNFPFEVAASELDVSLVKHLLSINPGRELKRSDPRTYDRFPVLIQTIAKSSQHSLDFILETKGILLQLFSHFFVESSLKQEISDKRIEDVLRYIRKNIHKDICIADLLDICYLNKDHFIRLFKNEMHITPLQYINQKKIEKAQLMLAVDDKPIKGIAYDLSFNNICHFYRLFKKITGIPPNEYKKRFGN